MKKYTKISLLFAASISLFSLSNCKKEEEKDKTVPVVTITTPTSTQMYTNGDTVHITGKVTDNELHEMLIEIRNDANDSLLYTEAPSVHDKTSYDFSQFWKSNVSTHTNATVKVTAEDHAGNASTTNVKIHIMP